MLDKLRTAFWDLEDQLEEIEARIACDCPPPVATHAGEDQYGRVVHLCNDCGGPVVATEPDATDRADRLQDALEFIAQQFCQRSEDMPCTETGACVTEYCFPCYAKVHL